MKMMEPFDCKSTNSSEQDSPLRINKYKEAFTGFEKKGSKEENEINSRNRKERNRE